jgi:hypothetical protein
VARCGLSLISVVSPVFAWRQAIIAGHNTSGGTGSFKVT